MCRHYPVHYWHGFKLKFKDMAYNYKSITSFLEKVNKEAEEAAQAVFDKYQPEFLKRVQAQIKEDDVVFHSMGACTILKKIYNENNSDIVVTHEVGENLSNLLGEYQYHSVKAGMTLPYKFTKHEVIKQD